MPKHYKTLGHGSLTKAFNNIWFVKGAVKMPMLLPMNISRTMTIIRDEETNDLTIVNSIRLNPEGLKELEKLGRVANVVRIGGFHGRDDGFYRDQYGAKIYAIKGQTYTRKLGDKNSEQNKYLDPDIIVEKTDDLPLKNAELKILKSSNPPEALILLKQDGGILITADSLQNTPGPDEFVNIPAKFMMKKFGFWKPYNVGPGWLQFASPSRDDVRSILDLNFEHVLPGHGDIVKTGAKEKYRPAIEGELKGCHS